MLLLLFSPSYVLSAEHVHQTKPILDSSEYKVWKNETYNGHITSDLFDDDKTIVSHKHRKEKKWSEHVDDARKHFRMRLRDLFRYLRRIRIALKNPNTDWDNFDWEFKDKEYSYDDSDKDDFNFDDNDKDDSDKDDTGSNDDSSSGDADGTISDEMADDGSNSDDEAAEEGATPDETDSSDDVSTLIQSVSVVNQPVAFLADNVELEINYNASTNDNQLSGIGIRIHFDSSILTFSALNEVFEQDIIVNGDGPISDEEDFDGNPLTDSYITFGWASLFNNWPGIELPSQLMKINFDVSGSVDLAITESTEINFTSITTTVGYSFDSNGYVLELSETDANWDFDGNGEADALTDGLIMMRYSFGLRGDSMVVGAMSSDSAMTVSQVEQRMSGSLKIADIDNNGDVDALTDGLLLLRHLFAIEDETFTHGAIGSKASRKTGSAIKQHLKKYMPKRQKTNMD